MPDQGRGPDLGPALLKNPTTDLGWARDEIMAVFGGKHSPLIKNLARPRT